MQRIEFFATLALGPGSHGIVIVAIRSRLIVKGLEPLTKF